MNIAPAPAPTLDNYVAGANAEAVAYLRALARGTVAERFVYLWGDAGSGRTHLLRAVTAGVAGGVFAAVRDDPGLGAVVEPMPLLAVDDVHCLNAAGQGRLFTLYNRMREGRGVLVASGTGAPAALALRADIMTRLSWGLVYRVHALTDEQKAEALERHAGERGLRISADVVDYLLRHQRRDLPSLVATLDALDRHSLETKRPVTVALLRSMLQDGAGTPPMGFTGRTAE